ncbi:MAG: MFS transporter [Deltaproteobacteria bacterium]|nr:MAG: MFS transporter [Deltaproteobacteria bacterium]
MRGQSAAVFHGWWIVLVAFVCHAVNTGLMFYAWGVFLVPLAAAFGGRGHVATGFSVMQLAAAGYSLGVGRIIDRRGSRPVQIVGAIVLATGFFLVSRVNSLATLYLCLAGPVALGSTCIGNLPNNAAVARWFVRRRGRALGISTAGISAGGIVFAPLAQHLIERHGWRTAYEVLAVMVLALVLPPVVAFMCRDPADLGLLPDGLPAPRDATRADLALVEREVERSVRPEVAVRQADFWFLAAAFGLTIAGLSAVLLYQAPLLIDRGLPARSASLVLGATAAMGVVGKLGFGALLDRFDQRWVAAVCFCLQTVGVLLLWQTTSVYWLACYVLLYGYAMGGNATLQASLVGDTFGRLHYGAIAWRMTPFLVLAQGIGVPATGYLRDATGSYGPALAVVMVGSLVAAAVVLRVRPAARPLRHQDASHR